MKILTRYVLREHAAPMVAALAVLVGMMLLNQLAKRFSDLVGKGLSWGLIAEVFALSIPFILAMTMPMAVLVAVLYTFNRLGSDNEITALRAGGVSLLRLMLPVLGGAALIAGGMIWFNDSVLPESNHRLRKLLTDIGRKRPTFELRERVINAVAPGKLFLQAAQIERTRSVLIDMVIFDVRDANIERTIYADSGQMAFNEAQTDLYLTLFDGSMHETDQNTPGTDQVTYYKKQVIKVPEVSNELELGQSSDYRGDREMSVAMMREEIASRETSLRELRDSLSLLIVRLAPGPAQRAGADRNRPTDSGSVSMALDEAESAEADSATMSGNDRPRSVLAEGGSTDSVSEIQAKAQPSRIREMIAAQRRVDWPPSSPATFASRVRAEFQRFQGRFSLNRREINKFKVEIHKKFAIPVAAVVFVLIGAPIGAFFRGGGIGMVIGVSLAFFCVYYVSLIGGEDLADRGIISPFWAMWAPNVLFGLIGLGVVYYVGWGSLRFRKPLAGLRQRVAHRPRSEPSALRHSDTA